MARRSDVDEDPMHIGLSFYGAGFHFQNRRDVRAENHARREFQKRFGNGADIASTTDALKSRRRARLQPEAENTTLRADVGMRGARGACQSRCDLLYGG